MATKTFDELKQLAIQIRDEKTNKQNTANRVGSAMLEAINKLEQDYYDKTATDEELKERDDKLTELVPYYNDSTIWATGTGVAKTSEGLSVYEIGVAIKDVFLNFEKKDGMFYSFANITAGRLNLWECSTKDGGGTRNVVDYVPMTSDNRGFRVSESQNGLFKILWNPNLLTSLNSCWYNVAGLNDLCWDYKKRFYFYLYDLENINNLFVTKTPILFDFSVNKLSISGIELYDNNSKYVKDGLVELLFTKNDITILLLFDKDTLSFRLLSPTNSEFISQSEIVLLAFNPTTKNVWGIPINQYKIDDKFIYESIDVEEELNKYQKSIDNYISSEYELPNGVTISNCNILANDITENNEAIAWLRKPKNIWYISASSTNENSEYSSPMNNALVLFETKQNKAFRMLKYIIDKNGLFEIKYYTRNNGTWNDYKKILSKQISLTYPLTTKMRVAISGSMIQCYDDKAFVGGAVVDSVPSNSRRTMFAGLLFSTKNTYFSDVKYIERNPPYAHFSVDDVCSQLRDLTNNKDDITSIFNNSFFSFWKSLHDEFGVVVTFNLFYSITNGGNWDLTQMTDKFKSEFQSNSSWLKFAFHGGDQTITYTDESNNEVAIESYKNTYTEVVRFAGACSFSPFTRLTYFSANKKLLIALKDTGLFLGCSTADDGRSEDCGLTELERECIKNCSDYIDFENELYYIRTSQRLDYDTEELRKKLLIEMDSNTRNVVYEYFNHGGQTETVKFIAENLFKRGIRFDFPENNMPFY